jgi:hypothetical protein
LQTIVFSIDEKDKEAYEKIRINGNFDRIIKNLEQFNEIRTKYYNRDDKIVRISGVKINDKQNVEDMKKKWGPIIHHGRVLMITQLMKFQILAVNYGQDYLFGMMEK